MTTWTPTKKETQGKSSPSNFYFKFFKEMVMKILEYKS